MKRTNWLATLALLPFLCPLAAEAQLCPTQGDVIARGTVFEDRDGDGSLSGSEPGVAGVSVSNGCEVTQTDDDGRYELPLAERQILFVTRPSGYSVATDAQ